MSNKELQIKHSFIYLIPVVVGNLIPLLTLPIFTRILSKEDYGVLALAQVYAIFVSGLANFGLTVGYERNFFEYKDQEKTAALLYSTLIFVITLFLLFGIFTYLFKFQLSNWIIGSADHANLLFWTYLSTGVMSLKVYYLTYFKNMENPKPLVWYTIDESILGIVLSLVLVVWIKVGVIGLVWGQLLASVAVLSALVFKFRKILPFSFNWPILEESLKLSFPLTPRIFFGIIGNQFDKYMIGLLATLGGVGTYSIGQKVANVAFTYMTAIQNVFAPQVYKRMFDLGELGGRSVGRYLTPFAYISVSAGLMISLFSEEIIFILTPKSYHDAVDVVIILSMLYGSYFFGKQPQLIFAKKTYITSLLTIAGIALNVGINIPFIMKWGMVGAAWGTLTAGLMSGLIAFIVSQHYYEIKWEYKKIIAIFGIFYLSSIVMILLRNGAIAYEVRLGIKCLALIAYIYLGVILNIITRQNALIMWHLIATKRDASVARPARRG